MSDGPGSFFDLAAVGLPSGRQVIGPAGHLSEVERPTTADSRAIFQQEADPKAFCGMPTPETVAARETARSLIDEVKKVLQRTNLTASLPAHSAPHLWSTPIDLTASTTVPTNATGYASIISYTVPPGRWARFNGYGVDVTTGGYVYDGTLLWTVAVNGLPVPTLADWGLQRGSVSRPRPTFFIAREGDIVTFQVRRAVAGVSTLAVNMTLTGWTWRPLTNKEGSRASVVV